MAQITTLSAAVKAAVHDGDVVALEGFTHLIPHAAGHEIIRQGRKHLTLIRMTPDLIYDQMIGMGCVDRLVFSWGGNPGVGSLHRFREAVEQGWPNKIEIEEHSHAAMANAYEAGAAGLGGPPEEPGRTNYGRGRREGPSLPSVPPLKLPRKRREERGTRSGRRKPPARRIAFWVGIAIVGWIVVSLLSFAISAQLQSFKLSGEAKDALHGNPFLLTSAQNILVMGTDARPPNTKEPGAAHNPKCYEQQEKGEAPHPPCSEGEYRADTLMVIRAGGGTFNKLSIPRDSWAEIPGNPPAKINAAFAYGGAALQIKTVEKFLNIKIDHVAIINFTGLENLVDAVGGIEVNLKHKLCAEIAGGAGHGQTRIAPVGDAAVQVFEILPHLLE